MVSPDRLRPATASDIPALEELIARSGRGLSAPYYTEEQAEALTRQVFGVDSQLVTDGTYYVIERQGRPLACGGWSRRRTLYGGDRHKSGPDPLLDPGHEPARIRAFFVDPTMARRGLGTRLMEECVRAARTAGFRSLELASTLPGVPLYEATGFTIVERFEIDLEGGLRVPLARMRRTI
ncbi:MAG: GNAT family N-acetyltransferase [Candidatus Eisenbacteria bacterium]